MSRAVFLPASRSCRSRQKPKMPQERVLERDGTEIVPEGVAPLRAVDGGPELEAIVLFQRAQAHTEPSTDQLVETAFVPDFERETLAQDTPRARLEPGPVLAAIHVDDEHDLTRRGGRVVRLAVLAPQALDQPLRCVPVVDLHEVRCCPPRRDLDVRERGRADRHFLPYHDVLGGDVLRRDVLEAAKVAANAFEE